MGRVADRRADNCPTVAVLRALVDHVQLRLALCAHPIARRGDVGPHRQRQQSLRACSTEAATEGCARRRGNRPRLDAREEP